MKVTREKSKPVYLPVNIELESEEELENLMTILEPTRSMSLSCWCEREGLNINEIDGFDQKLFGKLRKEKEKNNEQQ